MSSSRLDLWSEIWHVDSFQFLDFLAPLFGLLASLLMRVAGWWLYA